MNRSGYNQNRMMQRQTGRTPSCGAGAGGMQEHTRTGCGTGTGRMQEPGCGARAERMPESGCGVCGTREEKRQEHTHAACGTRTERMQDSGCGVCGARAGRMPERTECDARSERASEAARVTCDCTCKVEFPTDRCGLLTMIDEVSFGAYEALLYLDTHPQDEEAMRYFHEHNEKRNKALREYTRLYGPLNLMMPGSNKDCWEWMSQPWPWEGGDR